MSRETVSYKLSTFNEEETSLASPDIFAYLRSCVIITGRRLTAQQPGHYEATGSSVNPVVKKNHWQELTYGETVAHNEVHQLQVCRTSQELLIYPL